MSVLINVIFPSNPLRIVTVIVFGNSPESVVHHRYTYHVVLSFLQVDRSGFLRHGERYGTARQISDRPPRAAGVVVVQQMR